MPTALTTATLLVLVQCTVYNVCTCTMYNVQLHTYIHSTAGCMLGRDGKKKKKKEKKKKRRKEKKPHDPIYLDIFHPFRISHLISIQPPPLNQRTSS
ncbi:hypothetical protein I7I48_11367 [Histoplasma ohiense]|nr:hypothetical protein I7I48_11367 [Histoplasma ohiense (nom. inval.)]